MRRVMPRSRASFCPNYNQRTKKRHIRGRAKNATNLGRSDLVWDKVTIGGIWSLAEGIRQIEFEFRRVKFANGPDCLAFHSPPRIG